LVRASVCGAEGRGFEPHLPAESLVEQTGLFCCYNLQMTFQSLITVKYRKITFIVIVLMYLAGTIGLILPSTQPYFKLASAFNLWVSLILVLLFHQDFNKSFILIAILIFLGGFLIEVLGVHTGVIFGKYWYGETLGTQLWNVPLVIGANWLLLVYCSSVSVHRLFFYNKKKISFLDHLLQSLLAAGLMVLLDLLIEPIAIRLDFWHWQNNQIPVQNFQAWFLIAFILNYIFIKAKFLKINLLAILLLSLQFFFFISLNVYYRFF
jgi:uncharacterized membrane protein